MKKLFLALSAVALLGLAACGKEDDKTTTPGGDNPGGGGGETPTSVKVKIASISSDNDDVDRWNWVSDTVTGIDHYSGSQLVGSTTFTYNGNLLTKVSTAEGESIEFTYSGSKISQISGVESGLPIPLTMSVSYNGDNMSSLSMPISDELVQQLVAEMMSTFMNGGGEMELNGSKGSKAGESKYQADLTWTGNNVTRLTNTLTLTYNLPVEQMLNMATAMLGEQASQYATTINAIRMAMQAMGTTSVPLVLTVGDTTDFTYDLKNNPFHGFMGGLEETDHLPELLSKNNITGWNQHGAISYRLELGPLASMVPAQLAFLIANTIPGDRDSETITYQYNDKSYPTMASSSGGSVKRFTYVEE